MLINTAIRDVLEEGRWLSRSEGDLLAVTPLDDRTVSTGRQVVSSLMPLLLLLTNVSLRAGIYELYITD